MSSKDFEGRLNEMYSYPGIYSNGMKDETEDVCTYCQTPFRYVLVKNLKIDNGDPDNIMHQYCPLCDDEPKMEIFTKSEMRYI